LIGIYGGTFNPVHNAHLRMALHAYYGLRLRRVHMIPCAQPVHRDTPLCSAEQRFQMLRLALWPFPFLVPDRLEIDRGGPSYTIDTLKYFHQTQTESLCLIIGYDAFCQLHLWHEWHSLADYAHIVVLRRESQIRELAPELQAWMGPRLLKNIVPDELSRAKHGKLTFLSNPCVVESASSLREAVAAGETIRHRVPLAVADYIERNGLFRIN
jgi:nicotinate-nucleotide adenylyltransferase